MKTVVYKMSFTGPLHIGIRNLNENSYVLMADTLFSALCVEIERSEPGNIEKLVEAVRNGRFLISDAMPFIGDELYFPKPLISIRSNNTEIASDSTLKKAVKKLPYVPCRKLDEFISGKMDVKCEQKHFRDYFGVASLDTKVAIKGKEEPEPYHVGIYTFRENTGLYFIAKYADDEIRKFVEPEIESLQYAGIGGERSSGCGRFVLCSEEAEEGIFKYVVETTKKPCISLSLSLPHKEDLQQVIDGASFKLLRRGGFVYSWKYADTALRKKDFYAFSSGSYFKSGFNGDVYDVSDAAGRHPVYKYAVPMFVEVNDDNK